MAMKHYMARKTEIVDQDGKQLAIILATGCSKREAVMMAAFAAQQMNHEMIRKNLERRKSEMASNLRSSK